jgi:hypothetical protein
LAHEKKLAAQRAAAEQHNHGKEMTEVVHMNGVATDDVPPPIPPRNSSFKDPLINNNEDSGQQQQGGLGARRFSIENFRSSLRRQG